MLWVESHRALVTGDRLLDPGGGLVLQTPWLPEGMTREKALEMFPEAQKLASVAAEMLAHGTGATGDAAGRTAQATPKTR